MTTPPSTTKRKSTKKKTGTIVPPEPDLNLPTVDEIKEAESVKTNSVSVSLPMAAIRHGYEPRRVDVQRMSQLQRENLNRLLNGLIATGATLKNGSVVKRQQDAFKWVLEKMADV